MVVLCKVKSLKEQRISRIIQEEAILLDTRLTK